MVYLVACILERLFGKDTIEDIEAIRDGISIPDIIDGVLTDEEVGAADGEENVYDEEEAFLREDQPMTEEPEEPSEPQHQPQPLKPSATEWFTNSFGVKPSPSAMLGASSSSTSVFGTSPAPAPAPVSAFGSPIPAAPEAATTTPSAPAPVPPEASGIPIFRVASSGISQAIDPNGLVIGQIPIGINGGIFSAYLALPTAGTLPWDRYVAPVCVGITGIILVSLLVASRRRKVEPKSE